MRAHASWGSLNDAMLVFMNQDAYDKFRLSKEDYELQKELEKEQKEVTGDKADDKKKEDKADEKKDEKPKDIVVELKGIQDRILRLTPNSSEWVVPSSRRMARPYIISRLSKTNTTCGKWTCARKRPSYSTR